MIPKHFQLRWMVRTLFHHHVELYVNTGIFFEFAAIYFSCKIPSRKQKALYMQAQLAKTAKRKCLYLSMIWIHSLSLGLIPYKRGEEKGRKYYGKGKAPGLSAEKRNFIAITEKEKNPICIKKFPYKCFSFVFAPFSYFFGFCQ